MLEISLRLGTGGILVESTISLGLEINTFPLTAAAAGPMGLRVQWLTESILLETEPGLI